MDKLNPKKYKNAFIWQFEAYPFFTSVYTHATGHKPRDKYFADFGVFINLFKNDHLLAYQPKDEVIKIGKAAIWESLQGKRGYLKEFLRVHREMDVAIKLCTKARNNSDNDLECWWPQTQKALSHVTSILFCFDYTFDDFLGKLKDENKKHFEIINSHIGNSQLSFMDEAGKKLIELNNKYPADFDEVFRLFVREFGWFQNSYKGMFKITKSWLKKYLKSIKTRKYAEHKVNKPSTKLPVKYEVIVELTNEAIIFRDDKKKLLLLVVDLMEPWLKDICRQNNWDFTDMRWLTMDEIQKVIKNKKSEYLERAGKYSRNKKRLGVMVCGGYEDISASSWEEVQKFHEAKSDVREIKGLAASKGIFRGTVKVVLDAKKQINKFKRGDILVVPMTRPEYLPLMGKAGAFITDEGGISCHAAIVAREMNKPCIIATKIATQVLKDGMLVEVDADKGIVKILD